MFFVTTKHPDYVLFAMTPSERAAIGVTEKQEVHLLSRAAARTPWQVFAKWDGRQFSHTDFMVAWHHREEPQDPRDLLAVLPEQLRQSARESCLQ
ncbi:MAG: hypothetical protein N3C12_13825 [Candidatus Binatia bacterium]|nr:hypothetical protein [Candidatus Binatia bacterium]